MRPGISTGVLFQVNGHGKIVLEKEEEEEVYNTMLQLIIDHPRYFLDNLDRIPEFKVSWLNYGSKKYCARHGRLYAISHPKNISL